MIEAPDLAEPISAWRVWRLGRDELGPCLTSPMRRDVWPPRAATTARCHRQCGRPAPSWECTCGLYALTEPPSPWSGLHRGSTVVGCTALWGRVIEATEGWRGEHGYPLILFVSRIDNASRRAHLPLQQRLAPPGGWTGIAVRRLAERYAVPVFPLPWHVPHADWPASQAAAVRDEAVQGLAGRRAGDDHAHDRLTRAAESLLAAVGS